MIQSFVKLTRQCVAIALGALKVSCLAGSIRGLSPLGREVQYLPSSSLLEIPWPSGALENITHGAEITMAHPLNALKYILSGLVYLSTLIYKILPCSLPFLKYRKGL